MLILDAAAVRARAPMIRLIETLHDAFSSDSVVPPRQVIDVPGGQGGRLCLVMPAFDATGYGTVKVATVFPDNASRNVLTIHGSILVFSANGEPVALLDGAAVTQLRTAAASALASRYLSRADSEHLVVIGTGSLAPNMAVAHCAVRPIKRVSVWGRRTDRAAATVAAIRSALSRLVHVSVADDLAQTVATADIVTCATSSATPVLAGEWLKPGAFVDLVGSFSPSKRESDDDVVTRARIFVDTFEGAMSEAGDLLDPLSRGVITRERIEAELSELVRGKANGRMNQQEITVFKSVGTALEDLAAARLIVSAPNRG